MHPEQLYDFLFRFRKTEKSATHPCWLAGCSQVPNAYLRELRQNKTNDPWCYANDNRFLGLHVSHSSLSSWLTSSCMTLKVNSQIFILSNLKQSTGESGDVPKRNPHRQACVEQLPMMILPQGSNNTKRPAHWQSKQQKIINAMKNIGGAFIKIKHVVSGQGKFHNASWGKHPA